MEGGQERSSSSEKSGWLLALVWGIRICSLPGSILVSRIRLQRPQEGRQQPVGRHVCDIASHLSH